MSTRMLVLIALIGAVIVAFLAGVIVAHAHPTGKDAVPAPSRAM